jgi:arginine deiminase
MSPLVSFVDTLQSKMSPSNKEMLLPFLSSAEATMKPLSSKNFLTDFAMAFKGAVAIAPMAKQICKKLVLFISVGLKFHFIDIVVSLRRRDLMM